MLVKHIAKQGLLLRNVGAMSRAAYHGNDIKVTMDDLPVPKGDWKEQYTRQNSKYNAILLTGVVALASTIAFLKTSNVIDFNFDPPASID